MFKEFIQSYFQDVDLKKIVVDVLGCDNAIAIERLVSKYLLKYEQNSQIEKIHFIEASAGIVFGFLLSTNQKIVLKIYNKNIPIDYLKKMHEIQAVFYKESFPAPKVLSPILEIKGLYAGIYDFIEGKKADGHDSEIRNELAKYLARFSQIADKYQFDLLYTFMQISMKRKLWPIPHNSLFDLKKTAKGAGWISKKAFAAKKILQAAGFEKKLAHTDWDVKNTIFKNKKLVGVFDWDALGALSEAEMVGRACAQFTADWELGNKVTPSPDEARKFIKEYEKYRGRLFTPCEYQVISASADYLIAMIARFEHAGGDRINHPYQDLLRECGDKSFLFVL